MDPSILNPLVLSKLRNFDVVLEELDRVSAGVGKTCFTKLQADGVGNGESIDDLGILLSKDPKETVVSPIASQDYMTKSVLRRMVSTEGRLGRLEVAVGGGEDVKQMNGVASKVKKLASDFKAVAGKLERSIDTLKSELADVSVYKEHKDLTEVENKMDDMQLRMNEADNHIKQDKENIQVLSGCIRMLWEEVAKLQRKGTQVRGFLGEIQLTLVRARHALSVIRNTLRSGGLSFQVRRYELGGADFLLEQAQAMTIEQDWSVGGSSDLLKGMECLVLNARAELLEHDLNRPNANGDTVFLGEVDGRCALEVAIHNMNRVLQMIDPLAFEETLEHYGHNHDEEEMSEDDEMMSEPGEVSNQWE